MKTSKIRKIAKIKLINKFFYFLKSNEKKSSFKYIQREKFELENGKKVKKKIPLRTFVIEFLCSDFFFFFKLLKNLNSNLC